MGGWKGWWEEHKLCSQVTSTAPHFELLDSVKCFHFKSRYEIRLLRKIQVGHKVFQKLKSSSETLK